MSGFGFNLSNLGHSITQLGRAAKDIGSSLESSLQNVADNLEGAFVHHGENRTERAGTVTRTAGTVSQSTSGTATPRSSSSGSPQQTEGSERERLKEFHQPGGSMGCGGAYGHRRPPAEPTPVFEPVSTMICDMCSVKFTLINRKKVCCECKNYFCGSCLPREGGKRYCVRCRELSKVPPLRTELMKLRVKDLQNYLVRKHVNTKACVEKKDLVELVLRENGEGASARAPPTSSSWEDPTIRVSDEVPLERKNNFPKSYVDSSHRRELFEKLSESGEGTTESLEENEETLVEEISQNTEDEEREVENTPVELMEIDEELDEVISVVVESPESTVDNTEESKASGLDKVESGADSGAVGAEGKESVQGEREKSEEGKKEVEEVESEDQQQRPDGAANRLSVDVLNDLPSSTPSSPRRFAQHSMVYLSELESLDDLKELSNKQVKEILAMNRVNFKGCVEKKELLKIVERLWRQEQRQKQEADNMDDDSLCKICMDSPVDCVMLECGHMCTCTNCGKQMAECPICRQYVIRVVRTFKA